MSLRIREYGGNLQSGDVAENELQSRQVGHSPTPSSEAVLVQGDGEDLRLCFSECSSHVPLTTIQTY